MPLFIVMLPALRNKATNVTHLAAPTGEPYCGTRVDRRLLPIQVRKPEEINCDKCRRSGALRLREHVLSLNVDTVQADAVTAELKPPRMLSRS